MITYPFFRILENPSPVEERPRSEPQVTSTESAMDHTHNNNNNNNNNTSKYTAFEDLRNKNHHQQQLSQQQQQQPMDTDSPQGHVIMPGLTQLDTKVGNSSDIKPDKDENKCFICKVNF